MSETTENTTKTVRPRKILVIPTATATSLALSVEVIGQEVVNFEVEVADLEPTFLHQLALKGIANFVHDKSAVVKDTAELVSAIEVLLEAVKTGTIFESARQRKDTVDLPKFAEAIMIRDNLDRNDKVARQAAKDAWNSLSAEDKKAIRADELLKSIVVQLNSQDAAKVLAEAGVSL